MQAKCVYCGVDDATVAELVIKIDIDRPGGKSRRARLVERKVQCCARCWATASINQILAVVY